MTDVRMTWKSGVLAAGYAGLGIAAGALFIGILKTSARWIATPSTPAQAAAMATGK